MDFRDEIYFLALTVKQEAEGESSEGKLAVAYTIMNRGGSVIDTCLRAYQFSCWNTESPTRMRIDDIPDSVWRACYRAACSAYFGLQPDPTNGATHYLNEELTQVSRGGTLPKWFYEMEVTVKIGLHTFLKPKK